MKVRNPYFLFGQIFLVAGLLLFLSFEGNKIITFISGCFIGLSLVLNIAFYLKSRKEKTT